MVNKQLIDWIIEQEKKGFSQDQIKNYLNKQGYEINEIDNCINYINSNKNQSIKKILEPNIFKLIIPIIFFIILMSSFFVNSYHGPNVGSNMCDSLIESEEIRKFEEEIKENIVGNNININDLIKSLEELDSIKNNLHFKKNYYELNEKYIVMGNIYLLYSRIYKLNPFFPIPCELIMSGYFTYSSLNNKNCRYFFTEENFNCINNHSIYNHFSNVSKTYKKNNFFNYLIHTLIIVFIIYLIVCLINLFSYYLRSQNKRKIIIISLILFLIYFLFINQNFILFLIFILFLGIYSSIKNPKKRKKFIYNITFILIFILISGLFIINFYFEKREKVYEHQMKLFKNEFEYSFLNCKTTTIISDTQIQKLNLNIENKDYLICENPNCSNICQNFCNETHTNIYYIIGDNPGCICGC